MLRLTFASWLWSLSRCLCACLAHVLPVWAPASWSNNTILQHERRQLFSFLSIFTLAIIKNFPIQKAEQSHARVIYLMRLVSILFRQIPLRPGARCMKLLVDSRLKLTRNYALAFFSPDLWSLAFAWLCFIDFRHCGNVHKLHFHPDNWCRDALKHPLTGNLCPLRHSLDLEENKKHNAI